jgi:hypothetical protein
MTATPKTDDAATDVDDDAGWEDVLDDAGIESGSEFVTAAQLEAALAPLTALLGGNDDADVDTDTDRPMRSKDVEAMIEQRMQKATAWLKEQIDMKDRTAKPKTATKTKPDPEPVPVEPTKKKIIGEGGLLWGGKG